MWGLQPIHLILILIIALVVFGPARLPELGRSLGKSITEFKNATRDLSDPLQQAIDPAAARREPAGTVVEHREEPVAAQQPPADGAQK